MQKVIQFTEDEYKALPLVLAHEIYQKSKKSYGCIFVDKQDKQELEPLALLGYLAPVIQKVFNGECFKYDKQRKVIIPDYEEDTIQQEMRTLMEDTEL